MKSILGIDNGSTGTWTLLSPEGRIILHGRMPNRVQQDYTKREKQITRLDWARFEAMLDQLRAKYDIHAIVEAPFTNALNPVNSVIAGRYHEATMVSLERKHVPHETVGARDSWQRAFLPEVKGRPRIKKAATQRAAELWPGVDLEDADSALLAEWGRRKIVGG